MPGFIAFWKQKARELQLQTSTLYFAYRDPRVPWYAKGLIIVVVAYAFSPIDLIPDFIPILGYLDDLIIVPLGVYLALRMIPSQVIEECRTKAKEQLDERPRYPFMTAIIISIWIIVILAVGIWLVKVFQ